jgi:RHH-type proline utilization regulon transcriptional repressor/proline dehydrogenase/delta 1-pyrroline-5-carboxylate dehydrogenase
MQSPPFSAFAAEVVLQPPLREAITRAYRMPEPASVAGLVDIARLAPAQAAATQSLALRLASRLRERGSAAGREGLVQSLLQEFALSSQEGIALMCLAEALLRIPDAATRDALIRDKIGPGDWDAHRGQSPSIFVNAATWGLLLTGKLVATHTEGGLANALSRVLARSGEPLVRKGVDMAMRLMGEQFVTGETIGEALVNARKRETQGFRYSYDMLGEAALTDADARRYLAAYAEAIHAIGIASGGRGIHDGPGISIKLSALHPRYSRTQRARVIAELYPRLRQLTLLARQYDIGLNIDAEEADRLDLSLDLLELLCEEPALAGWNGIGFVIQAYQKRCPFVIDYLVDLATRTGRRLMVRLVKGAYWDSEIKRAQVDGLEDYPVFTRKAHTDVSYLACARKMLAAPAALYPQFATHNAQTLAAICTMAGSDYRPGQYEFQCLHGMGEPLYEQVVASAAQGGLARPCRIYAPVGTHETLLAYLVRRLLENGANTSFVNRIADETIPIESLVADPVADVERAGAASGRLGEAHPRIALPSRLFGDARVNSAGIDLSSERQLRSLAAALAQDTPAAGWLAAPRVRGVERTSGTAVAVLDPGDRRQVVGRVFEASSEDVVDALAAAQDALPSWRATGAAGRAAMLERAADLMQAATAQLIGIIVREAGKTFANAIGEVREAVDFLRYYAAETRAAASQRHEPLGVVVCISPWNFPLSIFTGQVAAALAAGNAVVAKPAEQTPLIAAQAVRLLLAAGVPGDALQLLPGRGETVGAALVADPRVRGVLFTGSNAVARLLQQSLAGRVDADGRLPTLVAETGGQNAMIVDSSALAEQVVADVVASAFDSAGQRCSALRLLCVQEDVADRTLAMLDGAMRELAMGPTARLATDIGPVIDDDARASIEQHIAMLRERGAAVSQPVADTNARDLTQGSFVPPTLIEVAHVSELEREVFGPVLHVLRFRRDELSGLVDAINATGFGLTFGVHSRIDETIDFVTSRIHAGNVYVNRNMIGAVVGVQPFGGHGLSGTGPKAGGPNYLKRFAVEQTVTINTAAAGGNANLIAMGE